MERARPRRLCSLRVFRSLTQTHLTKFFAPLADEIRTLSRLSDRRIIKLNRNRPHREATARPPRGVRIAHCNGGTAMTVAPTLQKYLDQTVTYEIIPHDPTMSSTRTAEACHVPGDCLAKGVVLRRDGGYMLAILPASHHIHLSDLKMQFGDKVDLASEDEIAQLFCDCELGAVPPVGECYGLDVIVDDSIEAQREIYMEGGDHATLIHLGGGQFARLTVGA